MTSTPSATRSPSGFRSVARARAFAPGLEAAALAVVLAAAGLLFARHLHTTPNYDEGNYLASLDALRHGQALGKDVFLDQPPGFYVLLQVLGAVFGNSVVGVREGFLCVSLIGCAGAWAAARAVAGPVAGIAAATLLAIAPPFPSLAVLVEADPACVAVALVAIAAAAFAFARGGTVWTVVISGALFAEAVSLKLLALTAVVPIVALAFAYRAPLVRSAVAFVAGIGLVVLAFAVAYRHALPQIWRGMVSTHVHARGLEGQGIGGNAHDVSRYLDFHGPYAWLVLAGVVSLVVCARLRALWALWAWLPVSALLLVWQKPLLDHHYALLSGATALPAGASIGAALPRLRRRVVSATAAAAVLAFVGAGFYQQARTIDRNIVPDPPSLRWAVHEVRSRTSPNELVASDIPAVPYLAGRRMPGQLIDTSVARVVGRVLRAPEIMRDLRRSRVRVVVVGRLFLGEAQIVAAIAREYPHHVTRYGVTVYSR